MWWNLGRDRRSLFLGVIQLFLIALLLCQFLGYFDTRDAHAANFSAGDSVEVINTLDLGLKVRNAPAGSTIGNEANGSKGVVLGGPTSATLSGITYQWWNIRYEDGLEGWSAGGYPGGVDYLQKISVSPSSKFAIGNSVEVTASTLTVRSAPPGLNTIGEVHNGDTGQVISGPFYGVPQGSSGFYHFWNIDYGGISGWSAENWLSVAVNQPPTCSVSPNPSSGDAPLAVTFTINANDPDGTIAAWVLDVNGDGNADYSGTGNPPSTKSHTYTSPGTYTVILMVSDDDSVSANSIATVHVGSPQIPPTCSLSATPQSGTAPLTVTFSITVSDSDGSIETWVLDADGNGTTDYSGSNNPPPTISHTYTSVGTYTAALMVSDDDDLTAAATQTVSVSASPQPDLVVTDIQVTPDPPTAAGMVNIGITISNQGGSDITSTFLLDFFFDDQYQGHVQLNGLAVGAVKQSTWQSFAWPTDSGSHTIRGVVDSGGTISETNETNNSRTEQFSASLVQPELSCSPMTLSFTSVKAGANPNSQSVQIWNSADGTLNWSVSDSADWINLNPSNGTSTGETDTVTVSVSISGMESGTYTAVITISASGATNAPQSIPVTLTITNPDAVTIPDIHLESAIRTALGKPSGDITSTDLASITVLTHPNSSISNLSGLEYCTNLTELDFHNNNITDIGPIAGCTQLYLINLNNNHVSDISALAGLPGLKLVYLFNNQVSNVSPLGGLQYLQRVVLHSNQVSNIAPLAQNSGLSSGDEVDLRTNPLSETSVSTYIPQLQSRGVNVLFDSAISMMHDPTSLTFAAEKNGNNPSSQTISVGRIGVGSVLNWTATDDASWLAVSPTSGSSTGEHDTITVSINIAGMDSGVYQANITLSASGATNSPETVPVTLTIEDSEQPDLVIDAITWSPQYPSIGDTVTFTVTVKNQGGTQAGSSYVYYFIDSSQHSYDSVYSINSGASTTEAFTWQVQEGVHTIVAVADYRGQITESNESNNEKTISFSPTLSDLIVPSITWSPEHPSVGDSVTFTVTIKNQGNGDASSSKVYYFVDESQQDYDSVYYLDAGETTTETFPWTAEEGTHLIRAICDYTNVVPESDESNNEKTINYSATALPDLIIQSIDMTPENPEAGDSLTFTVTLMNQGTGDAADSKVYYFIDDIQQDYDSVYALDAGSTTTETFNWTMMDGSHVLRAFIDYDNEVPESSEENNENTVIIGSPDVSVEINSYLPATPLEVKIGETVDLSVRFTNTGNAEWTFYGAVSLKRPDGTEEHLQLKSISLTSGGQGNVTWNYIIDEEGSWDIVFGIWKEQEQVNSLSYTGWLKAYIFCEEDDTITPEVDSFLVNPSSIILDDSFTISYSVSDIGGSDLSHVELWRADDSDGNPGNWVEINRIPASGSSDSGSFKDAPSTTGLYWYGIHVVDNAGNWAAEESVIRVAVESTSIIEELFIEYIDPPYGASGETIRIVGNNFKKEKTRLLGEYIQPNVIFGDRSIGDFVSWTDREIVIRVPEYYDGNKQVDVRVELYLDFGLSPKTSNSVLFTYKEPLLESVFPQTGIPGDEITLRGDYFGTEDQFGNSVRFGATPLVSEIISWSDDEIVVKAPDDYGMGLGPAKDAFNLLQLAKEAADKTLFWFAVDLLDIALPNLRIHEFVLDMNEPLPVQFLKIATAIAAELVPFGEVTVKPNGDFEVFVTVENRVGESAQKLFTFTEDESTIHIEDSLIAHLASPGELRVYDSQENVTGLVNGVIVEEIPGSMAVSSGVFIKAPKDTYRYEVVGTDKGTYGLDVVSIEENNVTNFGITDVSTSERTVHQYTINWDALRKGEPSIGMRIDADGDQVFEQVKIVQPPIVSFTFSPTSAFTNERIDFDASDSRDEDGEIASYKWNFGDGEASIGKVVTHTYADPGKYIVVLAVIDDNGLVSTHSKVVLIEQGKDGLPIWVWICVGVVIILGGAFVIWRYFLKKKLWVPWSS